MTLLKIRQIKMSNCNLRVYFLAKVGNNETSQATSQAGSHICCFNIYALHFKPYYLLGGFFGQRNYFICHMSTEAQDIKTFQLP